MFRLRRHGRGAAPQQHQQTADLKREPPARQPRQHRLVKATGDRFGLKDWLRLPVAVFGAYLTHRSGDARPSAKSNGLVAGGSWK